MKNDEVRNLVEHLFRNKAGQITAILIKIFGMEHLALIEDVVQDTLIKAIQHWPYAGIPNNPGGWLLQTARNRALDRLRRDALFRSKQNEISRQLEIRMRPQDQEEAAEFEDEQLILMFMCCHPALPDESRIALVLKTLCGFSVDEIARAFLAQPATIAQRIVRAKRKLKEEEVRFEIPSGQELENRLETILAILYLMFNEGYGATEGDELVKQDLCEEAIRLALLLAEHTSGNQPATHALLALMLFQGSRLETRTDHDGSLLLLQNQDRSRWDQQMIRHGFYHLEQAATGNNLTSYHVQAGIAACHVLAPSYEETDWKRIVELYDTLVQLNRSPVFLLNRAVAVAMLSGPEAGLGELDSIAKLPSLQNYYLLPATYAELYRRLGDYATAANYYHRTMDLVRTTPERQFILRRLNELPC